MRRKTTTTILTGREARKEGGTKNDTQIASGDWRCPAGHATVTTPHQTWPCTAGSGRLSWRFRSPDVEAGKCTTNQGQKAGLR